MHEEVFDLFAALGATDEQLDFPMLYAAGRQGWAVTSLDDARENLAPMFDLVLSHVKAPKLDRDAPFAMVASILNYDNFLGHVLTGHLEQGRAGVNMPLKVLRDDGSVVETGRLTKLKGFRRLERVTIEEAEAGDNIAVAGLYGGHHPGHAVRAGGDGAAARHPGRSADLGHDFSRQRRPAGRARGQDIRAAGKDQAMLLIPPRRINLEQAIAYIEDDELVEVTPSAIRLRKRFLDPNERKRFEKKSMSADAA